MTTSDDPDITILSIKDEALYQRLCTTPQSEMSALLAILEQLKSLNQKMEKLGSK